MVDSTSPAAPRQSTRIERLGLLTGVAILLALTLAGSWRHSLWLDEAYTAAAVEHLGVSLSQTRGTMPLYYAAMWLWGQVSLAPLWLRIPSLAASVATIVGVQAVGRRFLPSSAVALVPVLLVLIPMFQVKAVEARPYAIWTLLVVICWYLVLRMGEVGVPSASGRRYLRLFTVLSLLGPLVHGLFICQLLAVVAFALMDRRLGITPRALVPAVVGCGLVTLALTAAAGESVAGAAADGAIAPLLVESFFGTSRLGALTIGVLGFVGLAVAIGAIRRGAVSHWIPLVWASLPLSMLLALAASRGLFYPRYLAPSAPAVALLGASGAACVVGQLHGRVGRWSRGRHGGDQVESLHGSTSPEVRSRQGSLGAPWLVVGIMAALGVGGLLLGPSRPRGEVLENWDAAAAYVAVHARPGDGLVFDYWDSASWQYRMQFRVPFAVAWSALDDPPTLAAIARPGQLGSTRRTYDVVPDPWIVESATRHSRVWVVGYRESWSEGISGSRAFLTSFEPVGSRSFDSEIRVELFRRRPR